MTRTDTTTLILSDGTELVATRIRDAKGKARGWSVQLPDGSELRTEGKPEALLEAIEARMDDDDAAQVPAHTEESLAAAKAELDEFDAQFADDDAPFDEDEDTAAADAELAQYDAEHPAVDPPARRTSRARLSATPVQVVKYNVRERFPQLANVIEQVELAVAAVREHGTPEANTLLNQAAADAYSAGLPITALGQLIGVSAAAARSRAIRQLAAQGVQVERTRAAGTRGGGGTTEPRPLESVSARIVGRYGPQLRDTHAQLVAAHEAHDAEAFARALYDGLVAGLSITALGALLGVSAAAARSRAYRFASRHGLPEPTPEVRGAGRAQLVERILEAASE